MKIFIRNNKKIAALVGIAVIGIFAALILYVTHTPSPRCIFDILTPEKVVEIFLDVKETRLNNPETEIFSLLTSSAKNFLNDEGRIFNGITLIRGEFFNFVGTEARIIVHAPYYSQHSNEPVISVALHIPPYQGYDINQRYKYLFLVEALTKFLSEPQIRGWTDDSISEISFWQIETGSISLLLSRNYRIRSILMIFSTRIREPDLLSVDEN